MAVDSKEKRLSLLNFGDGNTLHTLPEADGAINADDRIHLLDLYSGILPGGPVADEARGVYIPTFRPRRRA